MRTTLSLQKCSISGLNSSRSIMSSPCRKSLKSGSVFEILSLKENSSGLFKCTQPQTGLKIIELPINPLIYRGNKIETVKIQEDDNLKRMRNSKRKLQKRLSQNSASKNKSQILKNEKQKRRFAFQVISYLIVIILGLVIQLAIWNTLK